MTFDKLTIGQTFDWIDDTKPGYNSFFKRCTKRSARQYSDYDNTVYTVGSMRATVYHVGESK